MFRRLFELIINKYSLSLHNYNFSYLGLATCNINININNIIYCYVFLTQNRYLIVRAQTSCLRSRIIY